MGEGFALPGAPARRCPKCLRAFQAAAALAKYHQREVEGRCVFVELGELNPHGTIRIRRSAKLPGGLGLSGRPPARETSWNLTRPEAFILCTAGSARLLCQTSTMADPAPMGPQPSGSLSLAVFGGERAFTG